LRKSYEQGREKEKELREELERLTGELARLKQIMVSTYISTLIKKKVKFSSYILGNSEWSSCKVIYEEGLPHI
jgi:hypothetical protein